MSLTWRSAFLRQAQSDHAVFRLLNRERQPFCQQLHYLQMATEKLAKGFLCPVDGSVRPQPVHRAFTRFMRATKSWPEFRRACGMNARQFAAYIRSLWGLASRIESLAPVGGMDRPNPEYPWQQGGRVVSPLEHEFPGLDFQDHKMRKLLDFIGRCIELCAQQDS